jgi:cysteine desulfurase
MTLYLDCNASNPIDPRVRAEIVRCFEECYGNAGSPHEFGERAKQVVHEARDRIAAVVGVRRHEVIFTSGATESNNLALLGLAAHGAATGKRHIVSTRIEHKAVLEPLDVLRRAGFEITLIAPQPGGAVASGDVLQAVRPDTLVVSVMQVNNETGVCQPIAEIAAGLPEPGLHFTPLFHVDAAQGFGKQIEPLRHPRIDLISVSGHKIHGPQGVGALVTRRRDGQMPPLAPLLHGGGQELGLRPGTLPVPLIVGMGLAARLALEEAESRAAACRRLRERILARLAPLSAAVHGDPHLTLPHVLNVSFPGFDADQVIETLRGVAAVSDGAACTSVCATASHVLAAMGVRTPELDGAVRLSWSHMTLPEQLDSALDQLTCRLSRMRGSKGQAQ